MNSLNVLTVIAHLRDQLRNECLPRANDEFERNAVRSIDLKLGLIVSQIEQPKLVDRDKRFGEITRMVEEIDPVVIPVEIGRQLIAIDGYYRALES